MSELAREGEIRPQAGPQEAFLACGTDVAFYGGAAGGGKTIALLMDPLRGIGKSSYRAIIFRREQVQITTGGGLWDDSHEVYRPLGGVPKKTPYPHWRFPSGARIDFRHLKQEETRFDYQGAQYDFIGFDELTHFTRRQFLYLLGRNRSRADGVNPWVRATMNPDMSSWVLDWVEPYLDEDGYADPERCGEVRHYVLGDDDSLQWVDGEWRDSDNVGPKSFTFIPADISDNPILLERNPGYLADLKTQRRTQQLRLLGRSDKTGGCWYATDRDGLFQYHQIQIRDEAPGDAQWLRYWDLADTDESEATDKTARTAGSRLSVVYRQWTICLGDDCYFWEEGRRKGECPTCGGLLWCDAMPVLVVAHSAARRLEGGKKKSFIQRVARADGPQIPQAIEQEGGGGAKENIGDYDRDHLKEHTVIAHSPQGDKMERAERIVDLAEQGRMWFVRGSWNERALDAINRFPDEPCDEVDTFSAGYAVAKGRVGRGQKGGGGGVIGGGAASKGVTGGGSSKRNISKYF